MDTFQGAPFGGALYIMTVGVRAARDQLIKGME
jgi:hypothetical protein